MSTEYLLRAQLDDEREREERELVPPGRIMRTYGLAPPARVIRRYARPGERDDNGVAQGADRAVEQAAAASGQALPADVRARFEASLGADLSAVRVHTGGASAAAAHAVGALAYTTGTDIHFAEGMYSPSDPFGLHLLAHEVAHTVQHHGAAAVSRNPGDPPAPAGADSGGDKKPLADLLEIQSYNFTKPGDTVRATDAGDHVNIKSPPVDLNAEVKVKDSISAEDKAKITKIQVGSIQNSTSSSRIGVYKKGDQVVAEHDIVTSGAAADAQVDSTGTKRNSYAVVPFYQAPNEINKEQWNATALMHDQPEFNLPKQLAGGVLTETKGSDNFVTAVAAKRDDEIVQLKNETWSVPWAVKIDPSMTGEGGAISADDKTKDKVAITDDSPIAAQKAQEWDSPKTVDAAKAMPPAQLLAALVACRGKDPDAYKNCCDAVTALNWQYTITVTCSNSYSIVGTEKVAVSVKGATGNKDQNGDLNTGGSMSVQVGFLDLFKPDSWTGGGQISISIAVTGNVTRSDRALTDTWSAPFDTAAAKPVAGSDNHYTITKTRA